MASCRFKPTLYVTLILPLMSLLAPGCDKKTASSTLPVRAVNNHLEIDLRPKQDIGVLSWSQDGILLAGQVQQSSDTTAYDQFDTIHAWNLHNKNEIYVSPGPVDSNPEWSPDGKSLVFMSGDSEHEKGVGLAFVNLSKLNVLSIKSSFWNGISSIGNIWLSPSAVVFCQRDEDGYGKIKIWDVKKDTVISLVDDPYRDCISPTVSPGRNLLAYIDRSGKGRRLIVMDIISKKVRFESTYRDGVVIRYVWGIDNDTLICAYRTGSEQLLRKLDLRDNQSKSIGGAQEDYTHFSINKETGDLAASATDSINGNHRIYVHNMDGKVLAASPKRISATSPAWSPDGERLAYVMKDRESRSWRIMIRGSKEVLADWKPNL